MKECSDGGGAVVLDMALLMDDRVRLVSSFARNHTAHRHPHYTLTAHTHTHTPPNTQGSDPELQDSLFPSLLEGPKKKVKPDFFGLGGNSGSGWRAKEELGGVFPLMIGLE